MQIPLIAPDPLEPLPVSTERYVAAIQNKKGELDALRHASDRAWRQMTPLIQIVRPKPRERPLRPETISAWVKRIERSVGSHPVYLDVLRMSPTEEIATRSGDKPILGLIYREARRRHLRFVPVVWAAEGDTQHDEIARAAALQDGHGLALRARVRTVIPVTSTWDEYLAQRIRELTRRDGIDADLIVDLEYLEPDTELSAEDFAPFLQKLIDVASWRAVVVLGTSMPAALGCIGEGKVESLPRMEWSLWQGLTDCKLSRTPCFGDYAIQHPRPPSDGGPGMRANIRYTCGRETLIARGTGSVLQEGSAQYRLLCQRLAGRTEFAGATYSWGDQLIDECARGIIQPGAQTMWRGAGTSHHLEYVTDQLRQWWTKQ